MKKDLTDLTFIILTRIDTIQRLENIKTVTDSLFKYFDTNLYVLEIDSQNNGILKSTLNRKTRYQFIEDTDPVMYRTKYHNLMANNVHTKYLAIWDTDVIVDKNSICDAMNHLHEDADVAYPYNGFFYEVPEVIKRFYFKHRDIRILKRHTGKMNKLYDFIMFGGAVIVNTKKYLQSGGENEEIYGWGNDDFTRHARFLANKYKIYRTKDNLFHLCHPRGINSQFRSTYSEKISVHEIDKENSRLVHSQ